jgi:hypothetical protein
MSVPLCSVQTINVSDRVIQLAQILFSLSVIQPGGCGGTETLLFLIAIVLGDFGLEQDAIRFIFGFDVYSRYVLFATKKKHKLVVSQVAEESGLSGWRIRGIAGDSTHARLGGNESRERTAGATSNECARREVDRMKDNFRLTPVI